MSKRNVVYVKPGEPSFLKRLKNEVGYEEGPTISAKRKPLLSDESDGDDEQLEDQPQIVVLKSEDLNPEQVEIEKKRLDAERNSKPANLNERIIFRPTKKGSNIQKKNASILHLKPSPRSSASNGKHNKSLSFNVNDEEEDLTE